MLAPLLVSALLAGAPELPNQTLIFYNARMAGREKSRRSSSPISCRRPGRRWAMPGCAPTAWSRTARARATLSPEKVVQREAIEARIFDIDLMLSELRSRQSRRRTRASTLRAKTLGVAQPATEPPKLPFSPASEEGRLLRNSLEWSTAGWLRLTRERRLFLFSKAKPFGTDLEKLARLQVSLLDGLADLDPESEGRTPRDLAPGNETFAGAIRLAPSDPLLWPFSADDAPPSDLSARREGRGALDAHPGQHRARVLGAQRLTGLTSNARGRAGRYSIA